MIFLLGSFFYGVSCISCNFKNFSVIGLFASTSLYVALALNELPQGGDFNSLIARSHLIYEFDLGLLFTNLVHAANFFNINISSAYALLSTFLILFAALRFNRYYLFASPFVYFLIITGYQRQGLGLILCLLSYLYFLEKRHIISILLVCLSVMSHVTNLFPIFLFIWSNFSKNLNFKLQMLPLIGIFFLPELSKLHPVLEHMVKNYLSGNSVSTGALPRMIVLVLLCFISLPAFTRLEKNFVYLLLLGSIIFFFLGASTIADRFSLIIFLIVPLVMNKLTSIRRFGIVLLNVSLAVTWMFFSPQFTYNWSIFS